jgi:hypothetical protein
MNPASGENTPGMMIRKIAAIRLMNVPSIATFSADRLFFYGKVMLYFVLQYINIQITLPH